MEDVKTSKEEANKKPMPQGISETAAAIYQSVCQEIFTVDDAVAATGLDTSEVLSALIELEIFAVISGIHGGRYKFQ